MSTLLPSPPLPWLQHDTSAAMIFETHTTEPCVICELEQLFLLSRCSFQNNLLTYGPKQYSAVNKCPRVYDRPSESNALITYAMYVRIGLLWHVLCV